MCGFALCNSVLTAVLACPWCGCGMRGFTLCNIVLMAVLVCPWFGCGMRGFALCNIVLMAVLVCPWCGCGMCGFALCDIVLMAVLVCPCFGISRKGIDCLILHATKLVEFTLTCCGCFLQCDICCCCCCCCGASLISHRLKNVLFDATAIFCPEHLFSCGH